VGRWNRSATRWIWDSEVATTGEYHPDMRFGPGSSGTATIEERKTRQPGRYERVTVNNFRDALAAALAAARRA